MVPQRVTLTLLLMDGPREDQKKGSRRGRKTLAQIVGMTGEQEVNLRKRFNGDQRCSSTASVIVDIPTVQGRTW